MQVLTEALKSKKVLALVLGIVATIAVKLGVDAETAQEVAAIVIAYLVGQGIADHGKASAEIEAKAVVDEREANA